MKPIISLLAVALMALCPSAKADDNTGQPNVSVQFSVVGWGEKPAKLTYKNAGKFTPLDVTPFARSPVYSYTGSAQMDLYDKSTEGKPAKVGTVDFIPTAKHFTVLLGGQGGHYSARVIADDESLFPMGSARVFNLTNTSMMFRYNQKAVVSIPSGQHEIVHPRSDFQLVTETAFNRNGQWKRSNDDFIYVPPDSQVSVFYFESDLNYFKSIDGGSRDIQLIVLTEKKQKEEAENK